MQDSIAIFAYLSFWLNSWMAQDKTFGLTSRIFMALFVSFFIHMLIVTVMGTFLDNAELKEILGGNSTLPVFIPTLIVCQVWVIARYIKTNS